MHANHGTSFQECEQLREKGHALMAEHDQLLHKADLVFVSGAPACYEDVEEYREELLDAADICHRRALELFRRAHATERFYRRAAA